MAICMIGYDLHPSSEGEYEELFAAIEAIGSGYWDCLELTWLVITGKNAHRNQGWAQAVSQGWGPAARRALRR